MNSSDLDPIEYELATALRFVRSIRDDDDDRERYLDRASAHAMIATVLLDDLRYPEVKDEWLT